jgi:integrating conjugative element protein (TIGR03765 family)
MRPLSMIIFFTMIASCYAFQIVNMENYYAETEATIAQESLKLKEALDARLPVKSKATQGRVSRHHVTFAGFANAIFIIGDDPVSKQWLIEHAEELRQLHALGFITNIKSARTLEELQTASDLPLLPANVDDLMEVLGASHYPLISNKGVVWQ